MKIQPRDAPAFFRKPDKSATGVLIFGADPMRVATARSDMMSALLGQNADEEMRLTRLTGAELRKDPAILQDAVKAVGFFPGARAVLIEEAGDGLTDIITAALSVWQDGDAMIVATSGQLTAKSKLRKAFEGGKSTYCAGLYDQPPGRDEVEALLSRAGLAGRLNNDGMSALMALSRSIDGGGFRQTVEKLGLYMASEDTQAGPEDVAVCAPQSSDADLDDILALVAEARVQDVGPMLKRVYQQGTNPVGICIGATRHFRRLHVAACDPGGPGQGAGKLRPPVFGPRRDAVVRQASAWGRAKLEEALTLLTETDLSLRSSNPPPAHALVERTLIRLSMMTQHR